MDYERKYNELVEAARTVVEGNPGLCKTDEGLGRLSKLLPEKDSEDERIRKALLYYHKNAPEQYTCGGLTNAEVVAWLERQKEQKPTNSEKPKEWSEEDKRYLSKAIECAFGNGYLSVSDWLKDLPNRVVLQPKQEWSEEDEKTRDWLIQQFDYMLPNKNGFYYLKARPWLKSLCPQPHWKPSEEQMKVLKAAIVYVESSESNFKWSGSVLEALYNDLKKLM